MNCGAASTGINPSGMPKANSSDLPIDRADPRLLLTVPTEPLGLKEPNQQ